MEYSGVKQDRYRFPTPYAEYEYITLTSGNQLPWLVLLHGFMGNARIMLLVTQYLEGRVNLLIPSLPGHGETQVFHKNAYSISAQLDAILAMMDQHSAEHWFLHGYSMGGRLALHAALSQPHRFSGFIFESTTAGIADDAERMARIEQDRKRADQLIYQPNDFFDAWEKLPLFSEVPVTERHKQYVAMQRTQSSTSLADSLLYFGTGILPSLWHQLNGITRPCLILHGELDRKFSELSHHMNTLLSGSVLHPIPEAAHRVHLDQPRLWAQALLSFIESQTAHS